MKINRFITVILGLCTCLPVKMAFAGGPFEPGKITDPITCRTAPGQSYAVYIPASGNKDPMPVIYFFDPHANGSLPLKKYKLLADAYGFILIGSNSSKNGNDWTTTEDIWRHLSDDAQQRLRINGRRVYTCGFSGGAKVAGYVALRHPGIKGVIAGGAGLPDGTPAGDFPFSFTAIAGEGDMNMTDLVAISSDLDKSRTLHRIIFFDGRHEWAPESTMSIAFAGLQLDAMQQGLVPKDAAFVNRYVAKSKARLDGYLKSGQLIKAMQECSLSVNLLDGVSPAEAGWFKQQAAALGGNPLYRQQRQVRESLLVREQNTKAEYMQHFQQGDRNYWLATIKDLQTKAGTHSVESPMYQRLLAYLSLAFYSISNQLINARQDNDARHFTELYKMADPTNSEAWYFSAILDVREGNGHAAESDLLKAVEYGFRDKDRLRRQVEFQRPGLVNLATVESRIREPE
jgi:dienelactone hydrolase